MRTSKTVIQSIAVAALAVSMMITAVTGDGVSNTQADKDAAAGAVVAVNTYEDAADEAVSVEEMDIALLTATGEGEITDTLTSAGTESDTEAADAASVEETVSTDEEDTTTASTQTEEEEKWKNKLMAKVDNFLYVRSKANGKSTIVGKMYKGDVATIKKVGSTWTKITSGKVKGYVKNSYCVTGAEALAYAKEICDTVAKPTTDGLHVREEQSTESAIIKTVSSDDKLLVDDETETNEDWVAVKVESDTCYVSADYVEVSLDTGKATVVKKKTTKKTGTVYSATSDEVKLLAAIAQCEVGGVSEKCMTAVAAVVLNRVKSSLYPNDIKSVIYQRSQFGPASSGKLARRLANGVSASATRAAKAALNGSDPTNGGMYFKLASSGKSGVVIGPVVFY